MKVAKLVTMSFVTRIIVDNDASDQDIERAAQSGLREKLRTEFQDNILSVEDDTEQPYDPDEDGE